MIDGIRPFFVIRIIHFRITQSRVLAVLLLCVSMAVSAAGIYKDASSANSACFKAAQKVMPTLNNQSYPCAALGGLPINGLYGIFYCTYVAEDTGILRIMGRYSCESSGNGAEYFYYHYTQECTGGQVADPVTGKCKVNGSDSGTNMGGGCGDGNGSGGSGEGKGTAGNPIRLAIGNKFQIETDYRGQGLFPLTVIRTYNSENKAWQFIPELKPKNDLSSVTRVRADGKQSTFTADGNGGWTASPNITAVLESLEDAASNLIGWRYTELNGTVEEYNNEGKLTSVTNRQGLTHTYVHTPTDITITHSNGDSLVYHISEWQRFSGFTDPDNRQYSYTYSDNHRLIGITYPNNGGTRAYHYESTLFPELLTGITDANGDRFATWAYDNSMQAISSEHHNGTESVTINYTHIADSTDPRVTVTNTLGKQTTYHFTTIHGVRKVTQVEGHQSANCAAANKAYTYDANGFLETKTDWKGNVTRYVRNAKGQELSRTEAEGTSQERTITSEWHTTFNLPTKITEPERETVITYDIDGNELKRTVMDMSH